MAAQEVVCIKIRPGTVQKAKINEIQIFLLQGGKSNLYTVLQHPVSEPVQLGGNTTLQCSILTENSAEDHSVYWFRHGSGDSHPGIIYTHGNNGDQCKKSSETGSPTQSCVYKFPKRNLSLSDVGTYYCAVAACGEIIFGNGTKLDFVENGLLVTAVIILAASNIISIIGVLFLCRKSNTIHHKDAAKGQVLQVDQVACDEDLNYAALTFGKKPSTFRGARRQQRPKDTEMYSQVIFTQ
ncbi:uncharacterized protein [Salminus brasiliensis]|uniref:uncharacterized protein n=1 Tax=Salminus brasiliensis TaxID=930266 RepID=UPI003B832B11